jgi:hypothetical protein
MPKFFVYKLITDNGGAPCVTSDLLSLAICKPSIRSAAHTGDWIFGFGDNDGLQNRLIYIAEVTGKLTNSTYYLASVFRDRYDCIYAQDRHGFLQHRRGARFHGGDRDKARDVGDHPQYRKANVVLSTNFRYYGRANSPAVDPVLQTFVRERVIQGHRSRFDDDLGVLKALKALRDDAWSVPTMKIGTPSHRDPTRKCNR